LIAYQQLQEFAHLELDSKSPNFLKSQYLLCIDSGIWNGISVMPDLFRHPCMDSRPRGNDKKR